MNPDDIAKINKHLFTLVQDMAPNNVVDYLISANIFNEHHMNEINVSASCRVLTHLLEYRQLILIDDILLHFEFQGQLSSEEKNRKLISILKTRRGVAFHRFVMALKATNQSKLADLLDAHNESLSLTFKEIIKPVNHEKFNENQLEDKLKL